MKKVLIDVMYAVALCMAADGVLAQTPAVGQALRPAPAPMEVKMVKPSVYMVIGKGGNAAFVVGADGVVLVDTKSPGQANYDELVAMIKSVTPFPVKEAIVTHHHPDHSGNIGAFETAGVPVVGHEAMAGALERFSATSQAKRPPPNVTFADQLVVNAGGITAEVHHYGSGHSGNDSVVYFPAQKVVMAGDQIENMPSIDYPYGASAAGWMKSMDAIIKLDFDLLIPGHGGEPMTKAQVLAYRTNVQTFIERGRAAVKAGVPKDKLLTSIKTDDLGWPVNTQNWTAPARLDGLYDEFSR